MKIDEFTMKNLPCESCGAIGYKNVLDNQIHDYQLNGKAATWHYSLRQCTNCGMGFISPKPSFEILQTFYSSNYGSYTAATNLEKEATSLKYKLAKFRYASTFGSSINNRAATALGMMSEWLTGKVVSYTLGIPLNLPNDANILELGYGSGSSATLTVARFLCYNIFVPYSIPFPKGQPVGGEPRVGFRKWFEEFDAQAWD